MSCEIVCLKKSIFIINRIHVIWLQLGQRHGLTILISERKVSSLTFSMNGKLTFIIIIFIIYTIMSITAQCILNLNVFILFFRYDTNLAETVWILSWEVWLSNFKSNSFTQPNCIFPLLLSISKRSDLLLLNVKRYMNVLHCYH